MQENGWPRDSLDGVIKNAADMVGLGGVINGALAGTVAVLGDAAAWTVSPEPVYGEFRKAGHSVHQRTDIFNLDLEQNRRGGRLARHQVQGLGVHGKERPPAFPD